jgi:O-antigen/teichoic acid export membrane protein
MDNDNLSADDGALFQRFKTSVLSYGLRQFVVIALTFGYNIALTHYLLPAEFGRVAVILIVVNIAMLLADGGFGVYLIQRHAEIKDHDLSRVTTIQLTAASLLSTLCFLSSGAASVFYPGQQVGWMLSFASLSLPLLVIRGMALLLLERSVRINKVVRVELFEECVYASVAIGLASHGLGAWSVVVAQICKALVGCLTAVSIGTFRFKLVPINWDEDLQKGLRFGFHYQAAQLINMARVSIIPLYIVPVLGFQAAGFVERSWYFCAAPLSIILAVQKKTMFPYISRIQFDLDKIRSFTEDSIYLSAVVDKIMFLPLLIFARDVILVIFGEYWLPMLPLIYWLLAGNIIFGALTGTLYPVANGLGKSEYISVLNLAGFILSWLLIVPLTQAYGIVGVGIAGLIMWGGIHWFKVKIRSSIGEFHYYRQILKPLVAFAITWGGSELAIKHFSGQPRTVTGIIIWSIFIFILYSISMFSIDSKRLKALFHHYILGRQSVVSL